MLIAQHDVTQLRDDLMMIEHDQRTGDCRLWEVLTQQVARSTVMNQRRRKARTARHLAADLTGPGQPGQPSRYRVGSVEVDFLAELPQPVRSHQHCAERIAIQSSVRPNQESLSALDEVGGKGQLLRKKHAGSIGRT